MYMFILFSINSLNYSNNYKTNDHVFVQRNEDFLKGGNMKCEMCGKEIELSDTIENYGDFPMNARDGSISTSLAPLDSAGKGFQKVTGMCRECFKKALIALDKEVGGWK